MAASARTVRRARLGKHNLRLVEKDRHFYGLVDGQRFVDGSDGDAGKADPGYFGFDGARARFLRFFPKGFRSDGFSSMERDYKVVAKRELDENAPLNDALTGHGFGEAMLSVFRATNMLSPYEKTRIAELLRSRNADAFVQAAAKFAHEGTEPALRELKRVLKPHDCAKWIVATYLPFLWRPEVHMFLKPEATRDFAARVGHPLSSVYEAQLKLDVYASRLDLAAQTADRLSDLEPHDRIDIQSFIWVVGDYSEEREDIYP